jgi:hypothetical protein
VPLAVIDSQQTQRNKVPRDEKEKIHLRQKNPLCAVPAKQVWQKDVACNTTAGR